MKRDNDLTRLLMIGYYCHNSVNLDKLLELGYSLDKINYHETILKESPYMLDDCSLTSEGRCFVIAAEDDNLWQRVTRKADYLGIRSFSFVHYLLDDYHVKFS